MGSFTIPLKRVIELTGGTAEVVDGRRVVTGTNIGLEHYPIFNPDYRETLNGLIVDHYWNQEIGLETVELFQLAMRRKMNEIMPYYNKMYESAALEFDPLSTIDISTIGSALNTTSVTASSENESTSNNESASRTVASETPQTMLAGDADYATNAADANSATTATATSADESESASTGEQESESRTHGYQGSAGMLLMQYRESLMNVDLMVIAELSDLFMIVTNNGDDYSSGVDFSWL